ncbi:MAG: DUF1501 domain-containing protein [Planctomycetes bacterium]|nr:DUF1501 domain-containing protein [Planctomycetota bacterium]
MTIDRRDFLRFGALGSAGLLTSRLAAFANAARPALGNPNRKLLVVFLRGGNDGVNTVVPFGDVTYPTARPVLHLPTSSLLPIPGSTFAGLHPALARLQPAMLQNEVAFLHAVGTDNPTRSHFAEMQKLETAEEGPASALPQEGFVPRLVQQVHAPQPLPTLAGVSIANLMQRMFLTVDQSRALTHMRSAREYTFGQPVPFQRLKGAPPSASDPLGDALWGCCAFDDVPPSAIDGLIRTTGENACGSEGIVQVDVADWLYGTPPNHNAARYPTSPSEVNALGLSGTELAALSSPQAQHFLGQLEEAVTLLRRTTTNVVGVDLGGFDTHQNQLLPHERLLHVLGFGLASVHADAHEYSWSDLGILVVTEFGRTSYENGSAGTDHGVGTVCMFLRKGANGGVYNCAAVPSQQFGAAWRALTAPPTAPIYADAVQPQTHFQTVLAEVCERHFLMAPASVDIVVPGILARTGRLYRRLGFL